MHQLFSYKQASRGEIEFVRGTIRRNPEIYGTAGGILALDPTSGDRFALLVYDFEKYDVMFSITQEHLNSSKGAAAFCEMAAQGNTSTLELLIDKGMDVNVRNDRGVTALAIAITRGQAETVAFLLKKGADPNIVYFDSFASLQQAIEQFLLGQNQSVKGMVSTYKGIITALLSHGADIEQAKRLSSRAGTASVSEYLRRL
jgi:ankyrin repeat protein